LRSCTPAATAEAGTIPSTSATATSRRFLIPIPSPCLRDAAGGREVADSAGRRQGGPGYWRQGMC
jgi:hypothetical protein